MRWIRYSLRNSDYLTLPYWHARCWFRLTTMPRHAMTLSQIWQCWIVGSTEFPKWQRLQMPRHLSALNTGFAPNWEFPPWGTHMLRQILFMVQEVGTLQWYGVFYQVCSLIAAMMKQIAQRAKYCHQEIGMIGFIYDSNGQTNTFPQEEMSATLPRVLSDLQCNAQAWACLWGASGGALELSICSCLVMARRSPWFEPTQKVVI